MTRMWCAALPEDLTFFVEYSIIFILLSFDYVRMLDFQICQFVRKMKFDLSGSGSGGPIKNR